MQIKADLIQILAYVFPIYILKLSKSVSPRQEQFYIENASLNNLKGIKRHKTFYSSELWSVFLD